MILGFINMAPVFTFIVFYKKWKINPPLEAGFSIVIILSTPLFKSKFLCYNLRYEKVAYRSVNWTDKCWKI